MWGKVGEDAARLLSQALLARAAKTGKCVHLVTTEAIETDNGESYSVEVVFHITEQEG